MYELIGLHKAREIHFECRVMYMNASFSDVWLDLKTLMQNILQHCVIVITCLEIRIVDDAHSRGLLQEFGMSNCQEEFLLFSKSWAPGWSHKLTTCSRKYERSLDLDLIDYLLSYYEVLRQFCERTNRLHDCVKFCLKCALPHDF